MEHAFILVSSEGFVELLIIIYLEDIIYIAEREVKGSG